MKKEIRLLIVDDDADDRDFFIEAVKEVDSTIECITARDGQQAIEILKNPEFPLPDYIFLDLRMPRYNGRKCLIEIKKDLGLKDIPVIIYTTSKEIEESKELQEMGAVQFISKPTNPEEIYYIVSLIMEEQLFALPKNNI